MRSKPVFKFLCSLPIATLLKCEKVLEKQLVSVRKFYFHHLVADIFQIWSNIYMLQILNCLENYVLM